MLRLTDNNLSKNRWNLQRSMWITSVALGKRCNDHNGLIEERLASFTASIYCWSYCPTPPTVYLHIMDPWIALDHKNNCTVFYTVFASIKKETKQVIFTNKMCCSVSLAVLSAFYVIPPLMTTSISLYYRVGRKHSGAPGTSAHQVYVLSLLWNNTFYLEFCHFHSTVHHWHV